MAGIVRPKPRDGGGQNEGLAAAFGRMASQPGGLSSRPMWNGRATEPKKTTKQQDLWECLDQMRAALDDMRGCTSLAAQCCQDMWDELKELAPKAHTTGGGGEQEGDRWADAFGEMYSDMAQLRGSADGIQDALRSFEYLRRAALALSHELNPCDDEDEPSPEEDLEKLANLPDAIEDPEPEGGGSIRAVPQDDDHP